MIGLVGPDAALDDLTAAAETVDVQRGDAATIAQAGPEVVVAVGERAVIDLADAAVDCPILPVDAGNGLKSVDLETAAASLGQLEAGAISRRDRPVLGVRLGDRHAGIAVFDVMLVTSEPARISEYSISTEARIARFRADGVVVATPAGSHGYAHTAGGPVIESRTDVLSAVPVAAFTTRADQWILDPPVTLGIERNEGDISLLLDDRVPRAVSNDLPVTISVDDHIETLVLDG